MSKYMFPFMVMTLLVAMFGQGVVKSFETIVHDAAVETGKTIVSKGF